MRFRSYNYHSSSSIERFASNLSAIEYIIGFKKRHPREVRIMKKAVIYFILSLFVIYLIITFYNAGMTNQAFKTVNIYSYTTLGYDVLADKGFFGHSWFYFTHPINNIAELGWNMDTRVACFMYEGLQPLIG